jgi:hypothetical protein
MVLTLFCRRTTDREVLLCKVASGITFLYAGLSVGIAAFFYVKVVLTYSSHFGAKEQLICQNTYLTWVADIALTWAVAVCIWAVTHIGLAVWRFARSKSTSRRSGQKNRPDSKQEDASTT